MNIRERKRMKIVHTADWHIGKILYGQQRYQEYIDILEEFKEHLFQREVIQNQNLYSYFFL